MNVRFDENANAADAIEMDFYIFILVPIPHPIQSSAMHVVFFVAYAESSSFVRF